MHIGPKKVDRGLSVPAFAEYFVTNDSLIVKSGDLRTQATQISGSECYLTSAIEMSSVEGRLWDEWD